MNKSQDLLVSQTNPRANYLAHQREIDVAVHKVLDSGRFILGEEVAAFENELASYIGVPFAIGVANGTNALELALRACKIGPGDAVLTVSHTAVATVAAIELTGATPVFVDIDPISFTMDPESLREKIRSYKGRSILKVIIPVHLYGHPADLPAIMDIANQHGLLVIEDCAQSHGASISGRMTGSWGDLAAFSFYPTKNLGAIGDGGAITTPNSTLANRVRKIREYGWKKRFISEIPGGNSRLDEVQASILRIKLQYLEEENNMRVKIAKAYDDSLSNISQVITPTCQLGKHVYHQYVIKTFFRDELIKYLAEYSIGSAIHYPFPVHLQPAYKDRIRSNPNGLPQTEKICQEIISLPIYPQLNKFQLSKVIETIQDFYLSQAS